MLIIFSHPCPRPVHIFLYANTSVTHNLPYYIHQTHSVSPCLLYSLHLYTHLYFPYPLNSVSFSQLPIRGGSSVVKLTSSISVSYICFKHSLCSESKSYKTHPLNSCFFSHSVTTYLVF